MKGERGSITVFICIVLAVLIPLCGILTDLARYNEAVSIAQSSLRLCAESMLAAYDRQLKEQYGLLAMHPRDVESLEKEIYELLSDNLSPETAGGNVTDLFRFKVRRVEVIPIYNLSEPYVLEQQVAEFMKYRAPVQAVSDFLERLRSMVNLSREAEMVERNMALDKLLNGLRSDMIYFSLLMDRKMKNINSAGGTDDFARHVVSAVEENNEKEKNLRPRQETIDEINSKMEEYRELKPQLEQAERAYESAKSAFRDVEARMSELEARLEDAKKKREASDEDKSSGEDDSSSDEDTEIKELERRISELRPEYDSKRSALESARQRYEDLKSKLSTLEQSLNRLLNQVLDSYRNMIQYTMASLKMISDLWKHLELHENYCIHAIELGHNVLEGARDVQEEAQVLKKAIEKNPGSAVAVQIGADLKKKLLNVDTEHIGRIIEQLKNCKTRVSTWLDAVLKAYGAYDRMAESLIREIESIKKLIEDKGDGNTVVSMYTGNDNSTSYIADMKAGLTGLAPYRDMEASGTYVIPDYSLTPPPTEKEQQMFEIWHARNFEGKETEIPDEEENADLENARRKIGSVAEAIAGGETGDGNDHEENEKSDSKSLEDILKTMGSIMTLPSKGGVVSSDENLAKISKDAQDTRHESLLLHNPLEDPVTGLDAVNEEDKGFFDNELERVRNFFEAIGEYLEESGEALIKNLYVNEYIVSAFKNYTTKENRIEHDIGWMRPLDKTFFDRAEVEYIIFGHASEKNNITSAKRTITVIRLAFNLLHVYSDPQKLAFTFKIASSIGGWTIFGVPIIQNFLLVGWAALESWVDSEKLMAGEEVPLIKTSQSWFLNPKKLEDYLINNVINSIKEFAKEKAEEIVDRGAQGLEETVMAFVSGKLDEIFSTITDNWNIAAETAGQEAKKLVDTIGFNDLEHISGDTVEGLLQSLGEYMENKLYAFCESIRGKGDHLIAECKTEIRERIRAALFKSDAYINLLHKVKGFAGEAIEKGFDAVSEKLSEVMGVSGGMSSGASNVLGRLIMTDYKDYLRLMLLTVSPEIKAMRCGDLIQLNMHTALPDNAKELSKYHTALYVKAWIDIDLWVIPESYFKKGREAMIVVEWAQGY